MEATSKVENGDELLEVRYDKYFHDIFNELNPHLVKWLIAHILEADVSQIKEKIRLKNIRLPNLIVSEKVKYCDLIFVVGKREIIVELNNNFIGSFIRNDIYAFSSIVGHYSIHEKGDKGKPLKEYRSYYQKDIETILVNLNFHKY